MLGERAVAIFYFHNFLGTAPGEPLDLDREVERVEAPPSDAVEVELVLDESLKAISSYFSIKCNAMSLMVPPDTITLTPDWAIP